MQTIDRLLHVRIAVDELTRAGERGDEVAERADRLFAAATGRTPDAERRRAVMVAVGMVANHTDDEYERVLGRAIDDQTLAALVLHYVRGRLEEPYLRRLRERPAIIASAVRAWRRRPGRPRRGLPTGSRWSAIACALDGAGLGPVSEDAVEQLWKQHGLAWQRDGESFIPHAKRRS